MNHWEFLTEKLGSDIVKYIIQPMLMPSEEEVRNNALDAMEFIKKVPKHGFAHFGSRVIMKVQWKPSWVVQYEKIFNLWINDRDILDIMLADNAWRVKNKLAKRYPFLL